jgi:hypothetical protein
MPLQPLKQVNQSSCVLVVGLRSSQFKQCARTGRASQLFVCTNTAED